MDGVRKIKLDVSDEVRRKLVEYSDQAIEYAHQAKRLLDAWNYYDSIEKSGRAVHYGVRAVTSIFGEDSADSIDLSRKVLKLVDTGVIDVYFYNTLYYSIATGSEAVEYPKAQASKEDAAELYEKVKELLEVLKGILFT